MPENPVYTKTVVHVVHSEKGRAVTGCRGFFGGQMQLSKGGFLPVFCPRADQGRAVTGSVCKILDKNCVSNEVGMIALITFPQKS